MRNRILLAIGLATALPAAGALAQATGDPPAFTAQEQTIIGRNAALSELVGRDPQLVRKVLDAIAAAETMRAAPALDPPNSKPGGRGQTPDPSHNPDLQQLERVSPEAALDLFQRIKRASRNR
jgi:hypothetical protein